MTGQRLFVCMNTIHAHTDERFNCNAIHSNILMLVSRVGVSEYPIEWNFKKISFEI